MLGIKSSLALGMQSGYTAVELALKQIGKDKLIENKDLVANILKEIKEIARRGTPINIENELPAIVERCEMNQLIINCIFD